MSKYEKFGGNRLLIMKFLHTKSVYTCSTHISTTTLSFSWGKWKISLWIRSMNMTTWLSRGASRQIYVIWLRELNFRFNKQKNVNFIFNLHALKFILFRSMWVCWFLYFLKIIIFSSMKPVEESFLMTF